MLEKQGNKPDPSMFAHVTYLAAAAILLLVIGALIVIGWRSHKKNTPPYTKHPVSLLGPAIVPSVAVQRPTAG